MKQFTVICRKEDYDEVAQILEGWGYRKWADAPPFSLSSKRDCVLVDWDGEFYPYHLEHLPNTEEPRYTLDQLRTMENPNT